MKTNPHITAALVIKGTDNVYKTNNGDVRLHQFQAVIKGKESTYTTNILDINLGDFQAELKGKEIIYTSNNLDIILDIENLILRKEGLDILFLTMDEKSSQIYQEGGTIIVAKDDEHSIICYMDPLQYSYESVLQIQRTLDSMHSEFKSRTQEVREALTPEKLKLAERVKKNIESIMKKENVNELTIERQYFPEIFSNDILEISKNDGLPNFKLFVIIGIMLYGIMTKFYNHSFRIYKLDFSELERKILKMGGISTIIGTILPYETHKIEEVMSKVLPYETHKIEEIMSKAPQVKGEILSFLDWVKDSEGLASYINHYLQQNNTQVISKLSKIYKELRQLFGI